MGPRRDYQLVGENGKPMDVGLFVGPKQAASYAQRRGWNVEESANE